MKITINNEEYEVDKICNYSELPTLEIGDMEFYVAESHEKAGEAARAHWQEMAEHEPEEFTCAIGEEVLVQWALNQWAGPGTTKVRNLEEWLDLHLDVPEEEFASYDGEELAVQSADEELVLKLGFSPAVAYRCN